MTTKIAVWGNSLGIRLPKSYTEAMSLKAGSPVEVRYSDGKIVILSAEDESLEEMVSRIRPENMHESLVEFKPVGNEVW